MMFIVNFIKMTQDLQSKRQRIDEIDAGILALLQERMQLALEIAEIKRQTGKEILDLGREEELFQKLIEKNKNSPIPNEEVLLIWGKIIELSRKLQEEEHQ